MIQVAKDAGNSWYCRLSECNYSLSCQLIHNIGALTMRSLLKRTVCLVNLTSFNGRENDNNMKTKSNYEGSWNPSASAVHQTPMWLEWWPCKKNLTGTTEGKREPSRRGETAKALCDACPPMFPSKRLTQQGWRDITITVNHWGNICCRLQIP